MWKIFAGLRLQRPAVVSSKLNALETKFQELYSDVELHKSHLSLHEKRHEKDLIRMAQGAKGCDDSATSNDIVSLLTAKDLELSWEADLNDFQKLAEQFPEVHDMDQSTAWRQLDRPLTLFTKQTLGESDNTWGLPVIEVTGKETLRSAVEKLVKKLLPPDANCRIIGNAPVGVHTYHYRTAVGMKQGVQMYFLNAYVDKLWRGETVKMEQGCSEFAWLCRNEFSDYLTDKKFLKDILSFSPEY